jgi:hypothetical protein
LNSFDDPWTPIACFDLYLKGRSVSHVRCFLGGPWRWRLYHYDLFCSRLLIDLSIDLVFQRIRLILAYVLRHFLEEFYHLGTSQWMMRR